MGRDLSTPEMLPWAVLVTLSVKLCCFTAPSGSFLRDGVSRHQKEKNQSPLRHRGATFCAEVLKGEEGSASGDFPGSA